MSSSFNKISRVGLDAASVATSVVFTAAKLGTKLGVRPLIPQSSFLAHHRHFTVLYCTRHHYNGSRNHWLCPRLWSLWWTHQRGACSVECCGFHALRYRTNHLGPNTHIRVLDIDLVYRGDGFLGPRFNNYARRGRSDIFFRQFCPIRAKRMG